MEMILFTGIQASGKTSFYRARFFSTHVRISLDMLKTRHRERILLDACLLARQPFVVDNTNPRRVDRVRYIAPAKAAGFHIAGYYFMSNAQKCVARNAAREGAERVPVKAIYGTRKMLELPAMEEGFDSLHFVNIDADGRFTVEEWHDEV